MLPFTVYEKLGLDELRLTKIISQLVDMSTRLPWDVVQDVLIKVREFMFSVDFILLDTERVHNAESHILIILEHPFFDTFNALINLARP